MPDCVVAKYSDAQLGAECFLGTAESKGVEVM